MKRTDSHFLLFHLVADAYFSGFSGREYLEGLIGLSKREAMGNDLARMYFFTAQKLYQLFHICYGGHPGSVERQVLVKEQRAWLEGYRTLLAQEYNISPHSCHFQTSVASDTASGAVNGYFHA